MRYEDLLREASEAYLVYLKALEKVFGGVLALGLVVAVDVSGARVVAVVGTWEHVLKSVVAGMAAGLGTTANYPLGGRGAT